MKVGDTVYVYDPNRREYARDAQGRAIGGALYRGHFVETVITGETRVSWIVERFKAKYKKKPAYPTAGCLTMDRVNDLVWKDSHRYKIARVVERLSDVAVLKQVAALIGYEEAAP